MNVHQPLLFERLLYTLYQLENINFDKNSLSNIPKYLFNNNLNLKRISLAENRLSELTFKFDQLTQLENLNIRGNNIRTIEPKATLQFESLFYQHINITWMPIININKNTLYCSNCRDIAFIQWLQKHRNHFADRNQVICFNENVTSENPFHKALSPCVKRVPDNKDATNKILVVVVLVISPSLLICSAFTFRHYLKQRKKKRTKTDFAKTSNKSDNMNFEYFVFLSFSSEDALFIDSNVVPPLTRNLRKR